MFGGGQERGWRPGTLPVALIAGFGTAAELAGQESETRASHCLRLRELLMRGLAPLGPLINGEPGRSVPHIVNLSIPGLDAEAVIEAWQDIVAISQGAACTSQNYTCSHVLSAMGISGQRRDGAVRLSWSHVTPSPDFDAMVEAIERAKGEARSIAR
jgi:cysteine desulfurase